MLLQLIGPGKGSGVPEACQPRLLPRWPLMGVFPDARLLLLPRALTVTLAQGTVTLEHLGLKREHWTVTLEHLGLDSAYWIVTLAQWTVTAEHLGLKLGYWIATLGWGPVGAPLVPMLESQ